MPRKGNWIPVCCLLLLLMLFPGIAIAEASSAAENPEQECISGECVFPPNGAGDPDCVAGEGNDTSFGLNTRSPILLIAGSVFLAGGITCIILLLSAKPETEKTVTKQWVCSACGNSNRPENRFCYICGKQKATEAPAMSICRACGAKLNPESQFCPGCGMPRENPKKPVVCPNCGQVQREHARYCSSCGCNFNADVTPQPPSQPPVQEHPAPKPPVQAPPAPKPPVQASPAPKPGGSGLKTTMGARTKAHSDGVKSSYGTSDVFRTMDEL